MLTTVQTQTPARTAVVVPTVSTLFEMQCFQEWDHEHCLSYYMKEGSITYRYGSEGCVTYGHRHGRLVRKDWVQGVLFSVHVCEA